MFYLNKEYIKALPILNKAINSKEYSSNISVYLYLSITQMELNNFTNAEKVLNKLIKSDLIDSEKGYWYKSLLYLKSNSIKESKNTLKIIIKNKYFNHLKAEELLKKLN